jgi:poly(A) polymerase
LPQLDPEKQRGFAVEVVGKLRAAGFEAFWAGGCVRDQILGRIPKDYDVATAARPDEIRALFGTRRTLAIGAAFGVITVLGPKIPAGQIEVATFRQDSAYSDGRHPDAVEFSTPEADAQRRDFTINGLFYDPIEDRVIDFVGGQDDLARGIVRAIGEPRARFVEDKLRLLRAVRFAATFDFTLDPATREAVEEMAGQITVVSVERIAGEMRLMLVNHRRATAVDLLRDVGLLDVILPELSTANQPEVLTATGRPGEAAWVATLEVLDALADGSFPLTLAALLHAFVDAAASLSVCRRWKLSNRDTQRTGWLVEHQHALLGARHAAWPKLQRILISEGIDELLLLHEAIAQAAEKPTSDVEHCRELLKMPRDQLDPPPLLSGDDLIAHGVPRGKLYQSLLEAVRDAQLEKKITTKQQALALVDQLRAAKREDDSTPG